MVCRPIYIQEVHYLGCTLHTLIIIWLLPKSLLCYFQAWVGIDDKGTPIHTGDGYSGSTPPPLISNTGKLAVKFITSAVGNHKGFTAVFTTGCELLSDASYTITPGRTSVISGDVLRVSCNSGYTFQAPYAGETTVDLTCQSDGEYDKTVPECSRKFKNWLIN